MEEESWGNWNDGRTVLKQSRMTKREQRSLRHQGVLDTDNNINIGKFNCSDVKPLTDNQSTAFKAFESQGYNLLLHGTAGTGKTFIGMYLGLQEVLNETYKKLVIVRSAVPTRDIGFLPGSVEEKLKVYEQPYSTIANDLFKRGDGYDILKNKSMVEFIPTSFIRGTTLNNCVVLVDEINNMTFHELDSVITRLGKKTRLILCGDFAQSDLQYRDEKEGLEKFMKVIDKMESFQRVEFDRNDIVRSGLVKQYIIAKEDLGYIT
jgi:predicted ribonuclease YlaK